jgi:hypothetical protein
VSAYALRALGDSARPRRLVGASGRPLNFTVRAQMNVIHALANLAVRVATVAVIAAATFIILLSLHLFGVPLHLDPVTQVLTLACMVAWRLYRGSTPIEEIERFLDFGAYYTSGGLRSNSRWRGLRTGGGYAPRAREDRGCPRHLLSASGWPLNFTVRQQCGGLGENPGSNLWLALGGGWTAPRRRLLARLSQRPVPASVGAIRLPSCAPRRRA